MVNRTSRRQFDATSAPLGFQVFNYTFMVILSLLFIVPFLLMAVASFTPEKEIAINGFSLLPSAMTFDAYTYLFESSSQFVDAFKITSLLTIVGTFNALFWTSLGAYALSKKYLPYRNIMTLFVFVKIGRASCRERV